MVDFNCGCLPPHLESFKEKPRDWLIEGNDIVNKCKFSCQLVSLIRNYFLNRIYSSLILKICYKKYFKLYFWMTTKLKTTCSIISHIALVQINNVFVAIFFAKKKKKKLSCSKACAGNETNLLYILRV
ncbi:hypothetical protein C0J52_26347 [Blattella germanica]|nr:hypothetical protein C0J52_26347 [Blattella germanica]